MESFIFFLSLLIKKLTSLYRCKDIRVKANDYINEQRFIPTKLSLTVKVAIQCFGYGLCSLHPEF